jgi:HSP20 family protein
MNKEKAMNALATRNESRNGRREEQSWAAPEVNIFETPEAFLLEGEMPGVNKEGLEITLEGNTLTIVGRRTEAGFGGPPLYRESRAADFRRAFELDPAVDTSKITASMQQGILKLQLPKVRKVKPRRIKVTD